MPKTRWTAFLIHLGLCAAIYVVLLYLIVFHWYPQPYFAADGGWLGVQLITGVDLVLGPLLTLIVYKSGKPELARDLTIIGVLQVVALVWGTSLVFEQRIAVVTYADGHLHTLTHELVDDAGGKAPEVVAASDTVPAMAFVRLPTNKEELMELRRRTVFAKGTTLFMLGDRYEPLTPAQLPELQSRSLDLEQIGRDSEPLRRELDRFLARHGGQAGDYLFLPLIARYDEPIVALRRSDLRAVDTLDNRKPSPPAATPPPAPTQ